MIGGGALLLLPIVATFFWQQIAAEFTRADSSPYPLIVAAVSFGLLGIASAAGLWHGAKWAWWLHGSLFMYAAFQNAATLLTLLTAPCATVDGACDPAYSYAKLSARICVNVLLVRYLFTGRVLGYFSLAKINKWKALSILVLICFAIGALFVLGARLES